MLNLSLSISEITDVISFSACFCPFSIFDIFTFCAFISASISYLVSVFFSRFLFVSSIFNSFSEKVSIIAFNCSCFSCNSFSNFCLFSFRLFFLSNFPSISFSDSSILFSSSFISSKYLCSLLILFSILDFAKLISEFNFSWLFSLSNPKFCTSSILDVISSIVVFNVSFAIFIFSNFPSSKLQLLSIISISATILSNPCLDFSILYIKRPTSIFFNSCLISKNFLALSDCSFKGSKLFSISVNISFILKRFNLVCSNFFSDSSFLVLNLTIPAASSNTFLLSSDLLLSISSIFPCPIIEYPSLPIPVSINNSKISFSLH